LQKHFYQHMLKKMQRKQKNETGFSTLELLLILVVLCIMGSAGWLVYMNHNKTKTSVSEAVNPINPPTVSTKIISSSDKKVSFALPTDWHVDYPSGKGIGAGSLPGINCGTPASPEACSYISEFRPSNLSRDTNADTANDQWSFTVIKSNTTPEEAAKHPPIANVIPSTANIVQQDSRPINGYPAYYVEASDNPPSLSTVTTYYFISHDGYLFTFQQNIEPAGVFKNNMPSTLPNPINQDTYLAEFISIAKSLKTTL
jgi:hypothetical protein